MKRLLTILALMLLLPLTITAGNRISDPQIKTLQVVVNQDWLSPAVMRLGSDDVLNIAFDELSHVYHRYRYKVEHCEADWSPSEGLFESEWMEGTNDNIIDDYENSINTTVAYTHYQFQIPNDHLQLKMSGNYRLHVFNEDNEDEDLLVAEFMVTEQTMNLDLNVTTNTDIDLNTSHQQMSMRLDYGNNRVTQPDEQIKVVVMQNGKAREAFGDCTLTPNYISANGLQWNHNRQLIFDAGNEYHKFEVLDVSHPTMGIDYIRWDGTDYQVFPFTNEPRPNYIYDEDADGAFYIRNSDNQENNTTSEYVWVNYRLKAPKLPEGRIIIDGMWTTDDNICNYVMHYDEETEMYYGKILQKQGYYSYRYLWQKEDGTTFVPSEGNFYQTENRYQALAYYRGTNERTWRLTAYRQLIFK